MDCDACVVFCSNLSSRVTQELLYELFLQAGPLKSVKIPKDNNGEQRSFAFIEYEHECSVDYAIELFKGTSLFGRELQLKRRNRNPVSSTHDKMRRPTSLPNIHNTTTAPIPIIPGPQIVNLALPFNSLGGQHLMFPPVFPTWTGVIPNMFPINIPPTQSVGAKRPYSRDVNAHDYPSEQKRLRGSYPETDGNVHDRPSERYHRRSQSEHSRDGSTSRSRDTRDHDRSFERYRHHDSRWSDERRGRY